MIGKNNAPTARDQGVDMEAVCNILARLLVLLDKSEYTDGKASKEVQQADVLEHTSLPNRASDVTTRRAEY